jgi:hypothetical protein
MDLQTIEDISLYVGIGGLIVLMGYIVWDLAKKSNAGKFGTVILFVALGLGVLGFIIKTIIVNMILKP